MRLSRGAAQPALLAFSRAETETAHEGKKALARLYRAQSMVAMQQPATALPMLESLVKSNEIQISRRAQAVQGDVLCRVLNDRRHGIPLMREALFSTDAGEFPGKARLAGNLGLYYLLEGRDDEGFRVLHESQACFEAAAQWDDLADSLANESACLRNAGKAKEADALDQRAQAARVTHKRPAAPERLPEPMSGY